MSSFDNQSVQYVTTLCSDPSEASRLLQSGYEFDLVLCDIYMPSVDGFAVLDLIKNHVSSSMHVALMSSSAQESTRVRGLRAGAVRVLTKPLQFEDFRELWHQVELRRSSNSDSTTPFEFQHHHDRHRHHQRQQQQQQLPTLPSSKSTSGIATSRTNSVMSEDPSTSVAGKASPAAGNSMLSSVLKVLDDASEGRQPDRQQAQNARNAVQQGYLTGKPSLGLSSEEVRQEYAVVTFLDALNPDEVSATRRRAETDGHNASSSDSGSRRGSRPSSLGHVQGKDSAFLSLTTAQQHEEKPKQNNQQQKKNQQSQQKQDQHGRQSTNLYTKRDARNAKPPAAADRRAKARNFVSRFKFFNPYKSRQDNSRITSRPPDEREHFLQGEKQGTLIQGATASFGSCASQLEALSATLPPRERHRLSQHATEVSAALVAAGRHLLTSNKLDRIVKILESLPSLDFDVFELNEITENQTLMLLAPFFMVRYGLVDEFQLDLAKLIGFTSAIEAGMPRENPYHNASHVADVLQSTACMIENCMSDLFLTMEKRLTIMALLLAAIIHDFQHPGVTEDFLINTEHEWAMIHSEKSVLEKQHVSAGLQVVKQPQYDFMESLTQEQRQRVRKLAFQLILATDMKKHFKLVDKFAFLMQRYVQRTEAFDDGSGNSGSDGAKAEDEENRADLVESADAVLSPAGRRALRNRRQRPFALDELDDSELILVLRVCIKVADLGHLRSPRDIHRRWTYSLLEEFWAQGDKEKDMGQSPAAHMDREQMQNEAQVAKSQLGFFAVIVLPMVREWSKLEPEWCTRWLERINNNCDYWNSLKDAPERAVSSRKQCASCGIQALCRCSRNTSTRSLDSDISN